MKQSHGGTKLNYGVKRWKCCEITHKEWESTLVKVTAKQRYESVLARPTMPSTRDAKFKFTREENRTSWYRIHLQNYFWLSDAKTIWTFFPQRQMAQSRKGDMLTECGTWENSPLQKLQVHSKIHLKTQGKYHLCPFHGGLMNMNSGFNQHGCLSHPDVTCGSASCVLRVCTAPSLWTGLLRPRQGGQLTLKTAAWVPTMRQWHGREALRALSPFPRRGWQETKAPSHSLFFNHSW